MSERLTDTAAQLNQPEPPQPDGASREGLTAAGVAERTAAGQVNRVPDRTTDSVGTIILKNVFTYFNLIFAVLAALLISVGSYRSLTFLPVIIANVVIGIVQQIRAKSVLDKLSLLDVTEYTALRDGERKLVSSQALVRDDVIFLEAGQQIPADAVVLEGKLRVNESLLTGEEDEVPKTAGEELKSGSFVVSGSGTARLARVGPQSYASQLTLKARKTQEKPAEMVHDIAWIIRITGILIIPVGAALLYQTVWVNGESWHDGIVSMVGAVIGMVPEGMYLLATVAFAMSAARLAGKKVLLHDMRSMESLARVDVLCVDKTGTITSDNMTVSGIFLPVGPDGKTAKQAESAEAGAARNDAVYSAARGQREKAALALLASYAQTVPDANSTMQAVRAYCGAASPLAAVRLEPFRSSVKYSEVQTEDHLYRFGAPEYLLGGEERQKNLGIMEEHQMRGERVLVLTEDGRPALFLAMDNEIRENAPEIFRWFHERDVQVKVISGDNPLTVSRVAMKADIADADRYVDATHLVTREDIEDAVQRFTVFGRVKPEQKKEIVRALRRTKHRVAMTGDGVNDILAMKEADCSIAMGTGSDAARQAAQVVLLDSDFARMKDIVGEGRRDVNNITRSATLFLYKNIFSLLLAIFSIAGGFVYPLNPSQISLISMFNIGIPAFLLALEDNQTRQKGRFLTTTLIQALPAALTSFFSIALMVLFGELFSIPSGDVSTASTYLLSFIGFMILWRISLPANSYHVAVLAICVLSIVVSAANFKVLFSLTSISLKAAALCLVFALAEVTVMNSLTRLSEFLTDPARRDRKI